MASLLWIERKCEGGMGEAGGLVLKNIRGSVVGKKRLPRLYTICTIYRDQGVLQTTDSGYMHHI